MSLETQAQLAAAIKLIPEGGQLIFDFYFETVGPPSLTRASIYLVDQTTQIDFAICECTVYDLVAQDGQVYTGSYLMDCRSNGFCKDLYKTLVGDLEPFEGGIDEYKRKLKELIKAMYLKAQENSTYEGFSRVSVLRDGTMLAY